jgi:PBP1b-binding outer membrane lipoprotein LpoB
MRTLYPLNIIYIALFLCNCSSMNAPPQPVTSTTTVITHPKKNPVEVSFLTNTDLARPYKIVGKATVSKFNIVGIKRQEATIRDIMRQFAASLNGDALIDVTHNDKAISATIIAYKQVVV